MEKYLEEAAERGIFNSYFGRFYPYDYTITQNLFIIASPEMKFVAHNILRPLMSIWKG